MVWIFASLVILALVYEAIALYRSEGDTISEIIWRLGRHPLVPFAVGVLMGHLFWCWPGLG